MSTFQVVKEKVAEVTKLAESFPARAAADIVNKAESLSLDEMSSRLDGALRALRGEDVSTSAAAATAQKTSLQVAQEMVESYAFDKKTGVSTFTVPAGVTDVEAMKALNEYFRKHLFYFDRGAVHADDLQLFEKLPEKYPANCQKRDYLQARQITITGVVEGTKRENRTTQESVLKKESLVFSDPRDQAIAAAIHACKHNGEDLFGGLWVRGPVPGAAVHTSSTRGVLLNEYVDYNSAAGHLAASGSPSPESRKG